MDFYMYYGRLVFALIKSGKWFVECPAMELPDEVKQQIKKRLDDAKILKRLID